MISTGFSRTWYVMSLARTLSKYALVAALVELGAAASMKVLVTTIGNALTGIGSGLTTSV